MGDPGIATVKDQERQDEQRIDNEFFLIKQFWDEKVGVEVVKGDDQQVVGHEEKNQNDTESR